MYYRNRGSDGGVAVAGEVKPASRWTRNPLRFTENGTTITAASGSQARGNGIASTPNVAQRARRVSSTFRHF